MTPKGFSLPELLITLTLISLLTILTLPNYQTFLTQSQDRVLSSQLLRAIALAKSETTLRGQTIILCPSENHQTCSTNWQADKILLADNQVLQTFHSPKTPGHLNWRGSLSRSYLQIPTHGEDGTFWYCFKGAPRWAIAINQSARAHLIKDDALNSLNLPCAT
jgi:type IV fimbrial biogenesis protein FimT